MGTVILPKILQFLKMQLIVLEPGTYKVKYSYGSAKVTVKVTVRKSTKALLNADSVSVQPFSGDLKSWKTYYGGYLTM